ncbi:MAG: hypothetical protein HY906_16225 [Deltaproteobacteria bacterium]|nr:hypothetical protein [Deltaproteobacteria bacterium]
MRAAVLVACAALATLAAGCKKEPEPGFDLSITAPDLPTVSSQLMCQADKSVPLSTTGAESLRLTVFRENALAEGGLEFVCDRVIPVVPPDENAQQPEIYAPIARGQLALIVAETWKTGAAQQDAGVPHDGPQADASQTDATDAPAQADGQQDAQQDAQQDVAIQTDGQQDGQQDAQQDALPQTDGPPQPDAGAQPDAGRPDGGTPSGFKLVASGRIRHVDLRATAPRTLVIDQARGFSCTVGVANVARAFHTATVLPDGRVALIGGLSLGASASSLEITTRTKVFGTASIEIYDPETQTFVATTDPGRSTAPVRAFHTAYLLTSAAGKATILLLGGVTSSDSTEFTSLVEIDGTVLLDVAPYADAKAAPAEIVEIDLQSLAVTRRAPTPAPASRFMHGSTEDPPAPLASTYPLVAGGASGGQGKSQLPRPVTTLEFLDAVGTKPGSPVLADAPPMAGAGRLGATVTSYGPPGLNIGAGDKPTWLVLGGNLWSSAANLVAETAEFVQATLNGDVPQSPTSAFYSLPGLPSTAFHTATPVRDRDGKLSILVAGGFVIQPSVLAPPLLAAFDPAQPGSGTPILSLVTGTAVAPLPPPAGFKAVGFHDAVRLADNSVLVTGGNSYNPQSSSLPNECPWNDECRPVPDACPGARTQQNSRQCALCQAARYFHRGQQRVEAEGNLKVARFGHRSTLLWDGRVLVTGGITSRLGSQACSGNDILMMLTSAEIYNPQLADEDPITMAADPNSDGGAAPLPARPPGMTLADSSDEKCCTCPSSVKEAKELANECASTQKQRPCVWHLE